VQPETIEGCSQSLLGFGACWTIWSFTLSAVAGILLLFLFFLFRKLTINKNLKPQLQSVSHFIQNFALIISVISSIVHS
jgi:hypothetical protein